MRAKGNLEPYLQQLVNFDASEISHLENERELAADMAVRCLQTGMLANASDKAIRDRVKIFLLPVHKKVHGRPIYHAEAQSCGLAVEVSETNSDRWNLVYELYVRTREFVGRKAAKIIEAEEQSFVAHASLKGEGSTDA